jgi:transposase-like protein
MSSAYKNCPNCSSNEILKIGFQSGRRRFKCKNCNKKFQSKKQTSRRIDSIVDALTFKKTILI